MIGVAPRWAGPLTALALVACAAEAEPSARLGSSEVPNQAAEEPPEGDLFGEAPDRALPLTSLGAIVAEPEAHRDQVVRTEGQIARVCQRMGCWMELRESEDGPAVRIPMAGHSFFLPRDAAGRQAQIQGRVALRELSPEARAHLEGEGAVATASALSIEATGVLIN